MRVLVTGAGGNIGRHVVRHALERGHEVWAIDLAPGSGEPDPRVRQIAVDVRDAESVKTVMTRAKPDAVIHLAAIPSPERDPAPTVFATNTQATFVVLESAGHVGAGRVAIASSISVLGITFAPNRLSPLYAPVDEEHPNIGSDPYAMSKEVDETTLRAMHRRHGYQAVALRIVNAAPMSRQIARAEANAEKPFGIAHELWSYLDVRDAARAFVLAVERDVPGCHVINVAAPDTYAAFSTADLMLECHPSTTLRRPLIGRETPLDLTRSEELLGFSARYLIPKTPS